MSDTFDDVYMGTALLHAKKSKAIRQKVGAALVTKTGIIIPGYNGTPSNTDNTCEDRVEVNGETVLVTKPEVLHAEMSKAARYDRYFMDIAYRSAEMSYAKRLRVGAVITRDNRIISTGFNGSPPGHDNCCELETENGDLVTKESTIHAEKNAILFAARTGISTENATIYCTHSPCLPCARLIANAGIRSVIYSEKYRDDEGVQFLIDRSVSVVDINTKSTTPKETYDFKTSKT